MLQVALTQRNEQLEALVAEQQLLPSNPIAIQSSAVLAAQSAGVHAGANSLEEPCANGCADASWQDAAIQVSLLFC